MSSIRSKELLFPKKDKLFPAFKLDKILILLYIVNMGQPEIVKVLDYIMNKAAEKDIEVIIKAIQRRQERKGRSVLSNLNFGDISKNTALQVQNQLTMPMDNMRKMVRDMVVKMIKQSVPDIPEEHLQVLLNEWMPEPPKVQEKTAVVALADAAAIPPDILLTMVKHFIEFSTHSMSDKDIEVLKKSLPNWYEEYWKHFPATIKELIEMYLNGKMELLPLWNQVKNLLGIDN